MNLMKTSGVMTLDNTPIYLNEVEFGKTYFLKSIKYYEKEKSFEWDGEECEFFPVELSTEEIPTFIHLVFKDFSIFIPNKSEIFLSNNTWIPASSLLPSHSVYTFSFNSVLSVDIPDMVEKKKIPIVQQLKVVSRNFKPLIVLAENKNNYKNYSFGVFIR